MVGPWYFSSKITYSTDWLRLRPEGSEIIYVIINKYNP